MIIPNKDKWTSRAKDAQYDPGFVAYLGLIFDPTRITIDVGANIGKLTKFIADRSKEIVLSFEPSPQNFAALTENVKGMNNVFVFREAIGNRNGEMPFVGDGTPTGHLSDSGRGISITVHVATLDTIVPANSDIGLIKIDVEGGELNVILGALNLIDRCKPLLAIEMIDGHLKRGGSSRSEIFKILETHGYTRAVNKYGMSEHANNSTGASDVFFLPDPGWYAPKLYIGYNRMKEGTHD
jgi:FkbM family methyltransferase